MIKFACSEPSVDRFLSRYINRTYFLFYHENQISNSAKSKSH